MKYVEAEHGSVTLEKVVLGSSNGTIEVEAVGLDKVRRNLGNLERLREVSLDCELVATGDAIGDILATCMSKINGYLLESCCSAQKRYPWSRLVCQSAIYLGGYSRHNC
jgi:hypothetical protein